MWPIINQYVCAIIMMGGILIFCKFILNIPLKISKQQILLFLVLSCFIHMITYLSLTGILKSLIMLLTNITFCKASFKIKISESTFYMFIYMIVLLLVDLFQLFLSINIFNISKEYYYINFAGSIIGNLCTCIITLTIIFALKKTFRKMLENDIEINIIIILFSILTFICTGMFFYTIISVFESSDDIFLYLLSILVLLASLFSQIKQMIKNNKLLHEYDNLLEFVTTYEKEIENQRILRHEIKNEFRTIRAKICDNQENKEIIEYIDEIVNDKYEIKKEKYAKFGYLPPNGIKGLCYFKVQEAENRGIVVSLNISKRIKNSTIYNLNVKQQRDFGRILGVFLDNAIEASLNSKEKKLGIETYSNSEKEFKLIISNTYNNNIEKNKIGLERFSTKGEKRGHGLLLAKKLVDNNLLFETKTQILNNIYIQTITVKKDYNE